MSDMNDADLVAWIHEEQWRQIANTPPTKDDDVVTDEPEAEETPEEAEHRAVMETIRFNERVAEKVRDLKITEAARRHIAREGQDDRPTPDLIRLDKFLDQEDTDPAYLIDRIWPTGGRILLAAQFKAGKTIIVGNLLRALADGDPFMDAFDVRPHNRRIILIDDELDPRTLRRWLRDHDITNTDRIELQSLRGHAGAFDLLDDQTRHQWAQRFAGADVIILDCLRPVLDALGLDENHEAGRFLVAFDALIAEAKASEAVVVHHMGHGPERARGDSRLADWPDATWKLVRAKDEEDPTMDDLSGPRFFSAYGRDVDQSQSEIGYDPATRRVTLSDYAGNRQQVTAHMKLARTDESVMAAVAANPGINKGKLREACAGTGHSKAIDASVERLVEQGLITRQIVGISHTHYPVSGILEDPFVSTMSDLVTPGDMMVVSDPLGDDTPINMVAASEKVTRKSDMTRSCPHGLPGGDQPDPFLNGLLSCPQCRSANTVDRPAP